MPISSSYDSNSVNTDHVWPARRHVSEGSISSGGSGNQPNIRPAGPANAAAIAPENPRIAGGDRLPAQQQAPNLLAQEAEALAPGLSGSSP